MTKEMERFRGGSWDSAYTYLGAHPAPQGYTFRVCVFPPGIARKAPVGGGL